MADQFFVYILKRRSKITAKISYYTGQTHGVLRRANEHKNGKTKSNKGYDIIGVAIVAIASTRGLAILFEKTIKKLTQKKKMEVYRSGENIGST